MTFIISKTLRYVNKAINIFHVIGLFLIIDSGSFIVKYIRQ